MRGPDRSRPVDRTVRPLVQGRLHRPAATTRTAVMRARRRSGSRRRRRWPATTPRPCSGVAPSLAQSVVHISVPTGQDCQVDGIRTHRYLTCRRRRGVRGLRVDLAGANHVRSGEDARSASSSSSSVIGWSAVRSRRRSGWSRPPTTGHGPRGRLLRRGHAAGAERRRLAAGVAPSACSWSWPGFRSPPSTTSSGTRRPVSGCGGSSWHTSSSSSPSSTRVGGIASPTRSGKGTSSVARSSTTGPGAWSRSSPKSLDDDPLQVLQRIEQARRDRGARPTTRFSEEWRAFFPGVHPSRR